MKISRILPVAGIQTLLACGVAFAQIPTAGAGVGVNRQPPGATMLIFFSLPPSYATARAYAPLYVWPWGHSALSTNPLARA
jgi:hypothetical protein